MNQLAILKPGSYWGDIISRYLAIIGMIALVVTLQRVACTGWLMQLSVNSDAED